MSNRVLTKTKFKKWLESKHPRTRVGKACLLSVCPIAKFLTQTTGKQYEVESHKFQQIDSLKITLLPAWACKFIANVDDSAFLYITAKKALEILRAT